MANPFVWVELQTQDVEKAKKFYKRLFAWELKEMSMGSPEPYTMIDVGEGTGGGMMKNPVPGPSHWLAYVHVEDVSAAAKKAQELGARIIQGTTEVPGFGWLTVITDPTGATLGLWEPKK